MLVLGRLCSRNSDWQRRAPLLCSSPPTLSSARPLARALHAAMQRPWAAAVLLCCLPCGAAGRGVQGRHGVLWCRRGGAPAAWPAAGAAAQHQLPVLSGAVWVPQVC
jgi:hypothetical protein